MGIKSCLRGFANKKGADQPARPRSLISTFDIRFFERNISKLATGEMSSFYLVSVAEESLDLSETPKTGFVTTRPKSNKMTFTITPNFSSPVTSE